MSSDFSGHVSQTQTQTHSLRRSKSSVGTCSGRLRHFAHLRLDDSGLFQVHRAWNNMQTLTRIAKTGTGNLRTQQLCQGNVARAVAGVLGLRDVLPEARLPKSPCACECQCLRVLPKNSAPRFEEGTDVNTTGLNGVAVILFPCARENDQSGSAMEWRRGLRQATWLPTRAGDPQERCKATGEIAQQKGPSKRSLWISTIQLHKLRVSTFCPIHPRRLFHILLSGTVTGLMFWN